MESPHLENEFWKAYKDKGLQVVSINGGENAEKVKKYAEKHKLSYPLLLDPNEAVYTNLIGRGFPVNIVVDQQGIVRYVADGFDSNAVQSVIRGLLQEQAKS